MLEVFSEVKAVLSKYVINSIKGNLEDIIVEHVKTASLEKIARENEIEFFLSGTLDGIVAAQSKIIDFLNELCNKQDRDLNSSTNESCKNSVECNDIVETATENVAQSVEPNSLPLCLTATNNHHEYAGVSIASECKFGKPCTTQKRPLRKTNFVLTERIKSKLRRSLKSSKWLFKKEQIRNTPTKPDCLRKSGCDILSENLDCSGKEALDASEGKNELVDSNSNKKCADQKDRKDYEAISPFKHFCNLCSFKTKRISHFKKHMEIHEKVSTLFKCSQCSFTSVRLSHLRRHEMTHSSTVHKCSQCHYTTDDRKFLMRHVRLKHRSQCGDKKSYPILDCPQCPYKTTKQYFYDRHKKMHGYDKKMSLYQCEQCKYKTLRKEHYVRHVNNVHGDKRPYLCHLCGKAFKRGDALQQHHLTHVDSKVPDTTSFKCSVCDKSFRSQSHLYEHKAVHSEIRSFLCEICGASFKTRSVQRKHVLTIHRNPRAYSCESCNRRFNTLYALKRHSKIHDNKICTSHDVETETGGITSNLQSNATEPKAIYMDCVSHDVAASTATPLQATMNSADTAALDAESSSVTESVQALISSPLQATMNSADTAALDAESSSVTESVQALISSPLQATMNSADTAALDAESSSVTESVQALISSPLQATMNSADTAALDAESSSVTESVQALISSAEVLTNVTSTFIPTSETATALLYLTNGYAAF